MPTSAISRTTRRASSSVAKRTGAAKKAGASKKKGAAKKTDVAKAGVAKTDVAKTDVVKSSAAEETLRLILARLDDMKAEEIVTIDLAGKSSIGDYMVVTSGRSNVHVAAIAENVVKDLKAHGLVPRIEGLRQGDWVLIDAGDVIVHVFRPEVRSFYSLEKMWGA